MLRGGETWPVKKEKQVGTFVQAVMRMIGWMCGVKDVQRGSQCRSYCELTETKNRRYNYSDATTYVKMVWTCFKKGRE